jgi:hypothetical protein
MYHISRVQSSSSLNVMLTKVSKEGKCNVRMFLWLISNLMHKILIYLHIIHLLKSSTCFLHYPAHLQKVYVVTVYMQPPVSSLFAGDCPVHRLRNNLFLNRCTRQSPADSDDTRGCIYTITT